jgi:hypothetical protein
MNTNSEHWIEPANVDHQSQQGQIRTVEFVIVFWGAKYRRFFTQFCLPSLLAPNNLPIFSRLDAPGFRGRLIISSTREDYDETRRDPLFDLLSSHVEVEFIDLGWPPADVHPMLHMSQGHKLALHQIMERKSFGSFLAPDIILSDGSIATLLRHIRAGARTILIPALRFDFDKCIDGLTRMGALEPGKPIVIAPRALARIAAVSLHSELRRFDFNANHFSDYPISTVFTAPGNGLIIHTSSWGLGALDFSQIHSLAGHHFDNDTIDAHFINDHIFPFSNAVMLADSDEFFMLPLTSEKDMPQEHLITPDPYLALQPTEVADLRKVIYIKTFLYSAGSDAFKRWAYKQAVRIHYADVPGHHELAASRALSVVDQALTVKLLSRPIYFSVVFSGEELRAQFLTFCLPSLMSPRNAPELAGIAGCRLLIATTKTDWDNITLDLMFLRLQSFLTIEFIDIGDQGSACFDNDHDRLAGLKAHSLAAARSLRDKAYISFLDPTAVLSDGAVARLIELANRNFNAVLAMAPQYSLDKVQPRLCAGRYLLPHRPIHITGRGLAHHSIDALHSTFRRCSWDGPPLPDDPVAIYVEAPYGFVMHSTQWMVLLVDLSVVSDSTPVTGTADDSYIERALAKCHDAGQMFCVSDTDDVNIICLKPDRPFSISAQFSRNHEAPYWALEVKRLFQLARYLESGPTRRLRCLLYPIPVRHHREDLTPPWRLVEDRTRAIVDHALQGSEPFSAPPDSFSAWPDSVPATVHPSPSLVSIIFPRRLRTILPIVQLAIEDRQFRAAAFRRAVKNPLWVIRRLLAHMR